MMAMMTDNTNHYGNKTEQSKENTLKKKKKKTEAHTT